MDTAIHAPIATPPGSTHASPRSHVSRAPARGPARSPRTVPQPPSGTPTCTARIRVSWIAADETKRPDGGRDHGTSCRSSLEPPKPQHQCATTRTRRSPGNGNTSAHATGSTSSTGVSSKSVNILPPLAATNVAGWQQLEPTGKPYRFVQDKEKARFSVG